ncbi:hypothetical protein N0V88_007861 [Collariella sp. IMI 366227]|nr:hypothetical protein N0V88_007861 [Collariella sp. IMI 366227]
MAATPSWATDALRGLSAKRFVPTRFWIIGFTSIFVVAVLFMGHLQLSSRPTPGPLPYSPMINPPPEEGQRPWLGAVICSAWDIKRRMLIRYSWMKLYKDVPMDQKFVISNPGPQWTDIVAQENRTFGDMIVLDHLQEDDFTANTIKTVEFYRWLSEKSPRKYEFVSKMDTDLFINARGMYTQKILPRLAPNPTTGLLQSTVNFTTIGQFYWDNMHKTSFPHGALYTVTWDIVSLLPKLQDQFHVIAGEDITMAWLLIKGRQKVTLAVMTPQEKFEFDRKDMRDKNNPWARGGSDLTSSWHALAGKEALAIHQLKRDEEWLMVAGCFDEGGLKDAPEFTGSEKPPTGGDLPGYPKPYFNEVPDDYWES